MAALNQQEQESIDALKEWWKQYGKLVMVAAILVIGAVAGLQAWRYYQDSQALKAAESYAMLQQAVKDHDQKKVIEVAASLKDKYRSTGYAAMAALLAAQISYAGGDVAGTKAQLQWVTDFALEAELKDVARLRLARVYFDEKDYAGAIKLLDAAHGDAFAVLYLDLKGDALFAQGKLAEARTAYRVAFENIDKDSSYRNVIQIKLDSLGPDK